MKSLAPHVRAILMEKYASYVAPKMKSIDLDVSGNVNVQTIEDRLAELAREEDEE